MAHHNDGTRNEPDIERKEKLEPGFGIGIETVIEASFNSQVQIQPCYECAEKRSGQIVWKKTAWLARTILA